uniref:Uncharacterized protein n=1 Tax=Heterorhabditis bacteriophora TaxID=37862 RepID=A0A1I7WJ72_HETBA
MRVHDGLDLTERYSAPLLTPPYEDTSQSVNAETVSSS